MKEFIVQYQEVSWAVFVVLFTVAALGVNSLLAKLVRKRWSRSSEFGDTITLLHKVTRSFLMLLGVGLLSFLVFDESAYAAIETHISRSIWIACVICATIIGATLTRHYFKTKVNSLTRRDAGDMTAYKYLDYLTTFCVYALGAVLIALAIPGLKGVAASALAGAGVFALVAGVAAQEGIANLIGGVFIVVFKPFRIGDVVRVGEDIVGHVEDIDLRQTVINNFQNKRVIIPNAVINKVNITNYDLEESKTCEWVEIGISYDSDVEKAVKVLQEVCEAHPDCMDYRTERQKKKGMPKVDVQVIGLGDSSVNLRAWVWAKAYMIGFRMRNDLTKQAKLAFDANGIEIPFPHRTIVMKDQANKETISQ